VNRRTVFSALFLARFVNGSTSISAERKKFIGVWKLISGESKDELTGELRYPWGKNPVGRLSYDDKGRVFAQLMNPGRRSVGGLSNRGVAAAIATASRRYA
jgi:Lipocalin-like domain